MLGHARRLAPWLVARVSMADAACGARHLGTDAAAHSTTVLCIRKDNKVVLMADGQVTSGSQIVKPNVKKLRRIGDGVIGGFAGSTVDGFTLFERLETKLEAHPGQLLRAAVELAKEWRSDKFLRRLEAVVVVADGETALEVTGNGDVLEPNDGIIAIGSGSAYALAAARALSQVEGLDAMEIADCCVYTNHNFTVETLGFEEGGDAPKASDGSTSEKGSEGGPKKGSEGSQKKGSEAPSPE